MRKELPNEAITFIKGFGHTHVDLAIEAYKPSWRATVRVTIDTFVIASSERATFVTIEDCNWWCCHRLHAQRLLTNKENADIVCI